MPIIKRSIYISVWLSCVLMMCPYGFAQQPQTFAAFKLLGQKTQCAVSRLAGDALSVGEVFVQDGAGELISDTEARAAYYCVKSLMQSAYAQSQHPLAIDYPNWQNFSTYPYRSKTHGNRYVNNYANAVAAEHYARYEHAGVFPVGSMLAKDSFVVDKNGQVIIGALALMEKMSDGHSPLYNNWRYTLVLPDGTVFSNVSGVPSASTAFCGQCHQTASDQDSLFFIPKKYRRPLNADPRP